MLNLNFLKKLPLLINQFRKMKRTVVVQVVAVTTTSRREGETKRTRSRRRKEARSLPHID